VLLRRLQDPQCLAGISHIILDEVHERGVSASAENNSAGCYVLLHDCPAAQSFGILMLPAQICSQKPPIPACRLPSIVTLRLRYVCRWRATF
jgi:hypothetical protein